MGLGSHPGHKFMMDNNPKHTSGYAADWTRENDVNWWKTPAESPDLNPTENLWHKLKEYIRREIKPKSKDELIQGIVKFWGTVDTAKRLKYIGHRTKIIPKVIITRSSHRLIGASLSEPHTNQHYEKTTVLMYVCMYICRDTSSTCSLAHSACV